MCASVFQAYRVTFKNPPAQCDSRVRAQRRPQYECGVLNERNAYCTLKRSKNVKTPCTTNISGKLRGERQMQTGFMGEKLSLTGLVEGHIILLTT